MTTEELAKFDGCNEHPAYVAVSGVIYDVSASGLWQNGNHVDQHQAGRDLTEELKKAPHVRTLVERFPTVGRLETPPEAKTTSSGKSMVVAIGILVILMVGWLIMR